MQIKSFFRCGFACKPGSVGNGHQSSRVVAGTLRDFSRATPGHTPDRAPDGVLLRIGFTADLCCHRNGQALISAFPALPRGARRFISVALSRWLPTADVIRYPCPVKPGLSSR